MTNETGELAARVRKILAQGRGITEKPMFGGICFLRRSRMLCAASKRGSGSTRAPAMRAL